MKKFLSLCLAVLFMFSISLNSDLCACAVRKKRYYVCTDYNGIMYRVSGPYSYYTTADRKTSGMDSVCFVESEEYSDGTYGK